LRHALEQLVDITFKYAGSISVLGISTSLGACLGAWTARTIARATSGVPIAAGAQYDVGGRLRVQRVQRKSVYAGLLASADGDCSSCGT